MVESNYDLLNDKEQLRKRVETADNAADIAGELGCMNTTVTKWVLYHDIEPPDSWNVRTESSIDALNDVERLRGMIDDGMSVVAMADELNVSKGAIQDWLVRHGIDERQASGSPENDGPVYDVREGPAWAKAGRPWQDEFNLRRAYWGYYWSSREIAEWCHDDVPPTTLRGEMKRRGIELRSASEGATVRKLRNRGRSVDEIRSEVPPPWERTDDAADASVEWSKLAAGADD